MALFIVAFAGIFAGGICMYFVLELRRRAVAAKQEQIQLASHSLSERQVQLNADAQRARAEAAAREKALEDRAGTLKAELDALKSRLEAEDRARDAEADRRGVALEGDRRAFDARVVQYKELEIENEVLKRDLRNLDINVRKLQLDRDSDRARHAEIDQQASELVARYLKDSVKWISGMLTANNFAACKQRLVDVIERCRGIGYAVSAADERALIDDLRTLFEKAVRAALEREEQARIKAQIREEQLREKEIERELKQLEREREAIQEALKKALADAANQHTAEVERLEQRLREAEERTQRAMSQAQMTKSGYVYVISNIGSFGQNVFKVGMTRRLEPMDRIRELGDASVPFPFDVHMMINADDAPTLENALHRALHKLRINKVNPRKEFFRVSLDEIRKAAEAHHGEISYVADAEALEFRQSESMVEDDEVFIEATFDKAAGGEASARDDD